MKPYLPNQKTGMLAMNIEDKFRRMFGRKTVAQSALTKLGQALHLRNILN